MSQKALTLDLVLKGTWFDMIESGKKPEEYRDIKPYWIRRLIRPSDVMEGGHFDEFCTDLINPARYQNEAEVMAYFDCTFKPYLYIKFRHGYQKDARSMLWLLGPIRIDNAKPKWAEGHMNRMFVLPLLKRLS